ncbi:MAG: hypothetical protein V1495_09715 [Pseudomonadota bacterium]
MADSKKHTDGLEGKHVEVFLKTPLFRFRYSYEGEERELLENAVRISGSVLWEKSAGLMMRVEVISNMKRTEKELPFEEIFLPYDKIDFVILD